MSMTAVTCGCGEAVPGNRQELEALWQERSAKTKRNLELASSHVRQVEAEIRSGLTEEGGYRYRQAVQQETAALVEYARALRIYTDLLTHRESPKDARADPH